MERGILLYLHNVAGKWKKPDSGIYGETAAAECRLCKEGGREKKLPQEALEWQVFLLAGRWRQGSTGTFLTNTYERAAGPDF